MDADERSAVSMSHLSSLPVGVLDELLTDAVRMKIPAGSVTHREGEGRPHLELVVRGVVRAFVTAPDGRTMTIRYCRPGALIGAWSLFSTDLAMPATTQALVDAELLHISPTVARHLGEKDVRVAVALLRELSERAWNFVYEIPGNAFATVGQRVARHLLDLASEREQRASRRPGGELIAPVTQQELADAVGTVREVVVRVLRDLREKDVVRTTRDGIVIVEPARLIEEQKWNQSS